MGAEDNQQQQQNQQQVDCLENPEAPECEVQKGGSGKKISIYDFLNKTNQIDEAKFKMSRFLNTWVSTEATSYFDVLYENYGPPYMAKNKKGGFCVWKGNRIPANNLHDKIILKDEKVNVGNNNEFLYSHVKLYIPPNKLNELNKLKNSIGYDKNKRELFVRSDSLENNYQILKNVLSIVSGNTNNSLSDEEFIKQELNNNRKMYEKQMNLNYYPEN